MRSRVTQMMLFALVMSMSTAIARAGDRDFDTVVSHIKKEYHGTQQGGLGWAGLFVKFVHPAGVKSMHIAVFEDLSGPSDNRGLEEVVRGALAEGWQPLVRIFERKTRNQTYVYTRPRGDDVELFIVNVDDQDATVLKAKIDANSVADFLSNGNWLADDH